MERIALLTAYTRDWSSWAKVFADGKQEYCKKHNYSFLFFDYFDTSRPPSWSKITRLQTYLNSYDWIFWSDADSMILNFDQKLEDFTSDKDISICTDYNGINCGLFMIKNTVWSHSFLKVVWEFKHHINSCWWEQCAFMDLLPICKDHFNLLPQEAFNSHPTTYKFGDFIMHLSGMGNDERSEFAKEYDLLKQKGENYVKFKF